MYQSNTARFRNATVHKLRPFVGVLILFVLLAAALVCSIIVGDLPVGTHELVRYAGSIFLLAAVALVSLAAGMQLLGRRRFDVLSLSLAFLAGYGFWGMLTFFTGLAHGLYPTVLMAELICLGCIFRRRLNELPGIGRRLMGSFRQEPLAVRITLLMVGGYLGFQLLVSLGPITTWDALESHWAIAKYFARYHAVLFPWFNGNGGTPQLARMLFTDYCVFGFDHQASHAVWAMTPALFGLVFGVTRRLTSSMGGLALAMGMIAILLVQPQYTTQPVLDVPAMVFAFGAFVAALAPVLRTGGSDRTTSSPDSFHSHYIIVAGILAGYAIGTKWHVLAIFPLLILCIVTLWRHELTRMSGRKALGLATIAALTPFTVFAIYDFVHTGHPFWHPMIPLFWNADYWSSVSANIFLCRENVDMYRTSICPSLFYNFWGAVRWIIKTQALILPGMLFVPFALFRMREKCGKLVGLCLTGGLLGFLVPCLLLYGHFRHTMLGVAVFILLIPLGWETLQKSRYRWWTLALPLLILVGLMSKFMHGRHPQIFDSYGPALHAVIAGPYPGGEYEKTFVYPAIRWANRHLPKEAFVVADDRRLGNLDRDWMTIFPATQFVIGVSPSMTVDSMRQALLNIGATHLWIDRRERWKDSNYPSLPRHMKAWQTLIESNSGLQEMYSDSLARILRISAAP